VVAPGPVPTGAPNADAAKVWAGRALEPKAMGRALARLGIQVGNNPKGGTAATARSDGAIFLNYTPSGEEMYDNASLNEELWHITNLLTLKAEWEEQGRPGDFSQFQDARAAEIFNELAERIRSLEGDERAQTEQALVDSFNLYFSKFAKGELKADSLEDIEAAFGQESYFNAEINPYSVVFEFARQLSQLRETNSITETTCAKLARQAEEFLTHSPHARREALCAITLPLSSGITPELTARGYHRPSAVRLVWTNVMNWSANHCQSFSRLIRSFM
jgi:hypothetical protein